MRLILTVPLFVLAACSQETATAPQATSTPGTERPASAPLATVSTLEGEWRVAGIDGQSLDEPVGIALSASATEVWWEPRCAGMARSYTIDGQRFTSGPILADGPPAAPGSPPPPVCTVGLPPRLNEVFRALSEADTIGRTQANGVAISGESHSLLLFSQ